MSFLPIVGRELRGASRRRGTYWVRTVVAGAAVLIGVIIFLATVNTTIAKSGELVFEGLGGLLFLYCLLSGRLSTVDCVSVEKREGTLGLLFLTDLKGYDVVLGKLVATSLNGFYGLVAVMPVLAFSMLLGGVSNAEFWRMALVLADTFLFSLAIGMFCSSVSRDARRATSANFALLLLFVGVLPAVNGIMAYFDPMHRIVTQLFYTCPIFPFILCFDLNFAKYPQDFWWSVGVIHAMTWLLLVMASLVVPRTWQDHPMQNKKAPIRNLWRAFSHGPAAGRAAFRKRLLDVNAFYWLAGRARFKPLHVWLFLLLMAGWWIWGWLSEGPMWVGEITVVVLLALMVNCTLKLWVTLEACQQLAEDQRMGTLELLLPTPLGVRDILRGQALALRRQFLGPLTVAIGVEFILMWVAMQRGDPQYRNPALLYTTAAAVMMLVADLMALKWVAMRLALTARSTSRAAIGAVVRILVLPWLAFGAVCLVIGLHNMLWPEAMWQPGYEFRLWLWFALGIAADLCFGLTARHQLLTGFRRLAMHRFNAKPSRLARWFGSGAEADASGHLASMPPVRVAWWRRKRVIAGAVLVLLAAGYLTMRTKSEHRYPPPVVVSITRSNTPLFISPGAATFLVLPDGSLWRWGLNPMGRPSEVEVPEPVGDGHDWVQVAGEYLGGIGLQQDGTLWGWGNTSIPGTPSARGLAQIGTDHDWTGVATSGSHSLAIKRDGSLWAWGYNRSGELGNGPGTNEPGPVQSGTNRDWVAVICPITGNSLGLRKDGTLWLWGQTRVASARGIIWATNATPVQLCRETNWAGFETGLGYFPPAAWTASGELWELPVSRPDGQTSVATTGRLILTNSGPGRMALASMPAGRPKIYQARDEGTLWENDAGMVSSSVTVGSAWRRVGARSDWVSVWGRRGVVFGLTADGTIWTWGMDFSRRREIAFSARLKYLQSQIAQLFSRSAGSPGMAIAQTYTEQPRPQMRLVTTGPAKPANGKSK